MTLNNLNQYYANTLYQEILSLAENCDNEEGISVELVFDINLLRKNIILLKRHLSNNIVPENFDQSALNNCVYLVNNVLNHLN